MRTRRIAVLGLLGGLTALAGCPSRATSTLRPEQVLVAYAKALSAGNYDAAYELMSLSFRQRYDRKEFLRMLRENPDEVRMSVRQLQEVPEQARVEARFEYGEGDAFLMVVEDGHWKLASDPLDFYSQRTPAEALRSFVRAMERRRYEIVLRFVPAKWAESMTVEKLRKQWEGEKREEVDRMLKTLRANLNAPIRETGDIATMPYGDKYEVRFVREDSLWKIEDPD
ncbi:MAG: hypothetical protein IT371_18155 [Deltaproteobacteria bacterium]|nr:hypothetical protein [Deltaproteobacteria bacterium]